MSIKHLFRIAQDVCPSRNVRPHKMFLQLQNGLYFRLYEAFGRSLFSDRGEVFLHRTFIRKVQGLFTVPAYNFVSLKPRRLTLCIFNSKKCLINLIFYYRRIIDLHSIYSGVFIPPGAVIPGASGNFVLSVTKPCCMSIQVINCTPVVKL